MNITYLLGAGASFDALPIVKKIPDRLEFFSNQFRIYDFKKVINNREEINIACKHLLLFNSPSDQIREYEKIKNFYDDIIWLKNESQQHSSIDTFAKKLYLQKDSNLKKLKYLLSCFFLYEQVFNFDKRYDSFFASILENLSELPNNMRIISWNYDSQLEIAYGNFSNTSIETNRERLNIISKGNIIPNDFESNKFAIHKVNGTTSISHKTNGVYDIIPSFNLDQTSLVSHFLEIHSSRKHWREYEPKMSFAWEKSNEDSIFKLNLKQSISETDILVVIGYSFPFFNRKMDKHILNSMNKLNKIYVQDPKYSNDIIEKIKGLIPWQKTHTTLKSSTGMKTITKDTIEFFPKTFTDQFFIPIEF